MRSTLEIVAEYRAGRTVVSAVRGGGHFAARLTGEGRLHLVGTAAGPLGGDEATIRITVREGADLTVRSAGATIIQPGLHEALSHLTLILDVGSGAAVDVAFEPTVVCAGAEHEARTAVTLAETAAVRLLEPVVLGRSGEAPGVWGGRLHAVRAGAPLLRHRLSSRVLGTRVVCSLLESGPLLAGHSPATHGSAVAMPLAAGGLLVTATGDALLPTRADLEGAAASARQALVVPN